MSTETQELKAGISEESKRLIRDVAERASDFTVTCSEFAKEKYLNAMRAMDLHVRALEADKRRIDLFEELRKENRLVVTVFESLQKPLRENNLRREAEPYSVIRHIAGAIKPNRDPSTFEMTVFNAYFDASGTSKNKMPGANLFVSGWVATEDQWVRFEREWLVLLTEHNITPPFHVTEYAKGIVTDADVERSDAFLLPALKLINKRTRKPFSFGVVLADLDRVYADFDIPAAIQHAAFPYCGRQALYALSGWAYRRLKADDVKASDDLSVIFEAGDAAAGDLVNISTNEFGYPISFLPKDGCVPFQAGDLLAWVHHFMLVRRQVLAAGDIPPRFRVSPRVLREFIRVTPRDSQGFSVWDGMEKQFAAAGFKKR